MNRIRTALTSIVLTVGAFSSAARAQDTTKTFFVRRDAYVVGGTIAELGNDAVIEPLTDDDHTFLRDTLARAEIADGYDFKKVVSGRRLWNFSKKEMGLWIQAL